MNNDVLMYLNIVLGYIGVLIEYIFVFGLLGYYYLQNVKVSWNIKYILQFDYLIYLKIEKNRIIFILCKYVYVFYYM